MVKDAAIPAGEAIRERIIAILRAGPSSISGVARALSENRDKPVHRLTVAGYLGAMAETGVLKELERPPSKLYMLQEPDAHRSLHQRVARIIHGMHEAPDHAGLAVAVLQHLLQRPIFAAELRHAGLGSTALHLPRQIVGDEVRRSYRKALQRHPGMSIEIPSRDPLIGHPPEDPIHASPWVEEAVRRLALDATQASHLRADGDETKQAHLPMEPNA